MSQYKCLHLNRNVYIFRIGMDKYKRLNLNYKLSGMEKPSDEKMVQLQQRFKNVGIKVKIGG